MTLGKFTVRQGLRADNPAFPVWLVFVGDRLIGKQFSQPSESDCEWLARQANRECISYTEGKRCRYGRRYSTGGYQSRNAERFK